MFSSNIGFRRRTVSEGHDRLLLAPSCSKRGSCSSERHSLDELTSTTTIRRVVLRKHSSESSTKSRGLADRIASGEMENIEGFWSRRLSGQRRSVPSPSSANQQVEWSREAKDALGTSQAKAKPRGPRPVSKVQVTSYLPRPVDPVRHAQVSDIHDRSDSSRTTETRLTYRPILPPGLPVLNKPANERRFAQIGNTFRKLVRDRDRGRDRKAHDPVVWSSIILPPLIPIPPISDDIDSKPLSRRKSAKSTTSVKSNKSSKSRKSSRKRKTGLAQIVIELAKGEKVVALDAEAIQQATEVRDILAQLRQLKAA